VSLPLHLQRETPCYEVPQRLNREPWFETVRIVIAAVTCVNSNLGFGRLRLTAFLL